jgi:hypothetical protein
MLPSSIMANLPLASNEGKSSMLPLSRALDLTPAPPPPPSSASATPNSLRCGSCSLAPLGFSSEQFSPSSLSASPFLMGRSRATYVKLGVLAMERGTGDLRGLNHRVTERTEDERTETTIIKEAILLSF